NRIRLWNLDTLTAEGYLHGHTGSVVALECDGDVLISGAYDATLRLWSIGGVLTEEATTPVNINLPTSEAEQPIGTAAPVGQPYRAGGQWSPASGGSRYQPLRNN